KKTLPQNTINKTIPSRKPACTLRVPFPSKVDSLTTSLNQQPTTNNKYKKLNNQKHTTQVIRMHIHYTGCC
ncbi:MAG TPA: hypothetical protein VEY70_26800, partial [Metabacillus sp.]|nr:hypothetical protein [Metabacillus sp.]